MGRFCPNTNNILYPKVDAENKKLKFSCRISNYEEEVAPEEYCVSRRMINHSVAEQTTFVGNVKNDPTLPRTATWCAPVAAPRRQSTSPSRRQRACCSSSSASAVAAAGTTRCERR